MARDEFKELAERSEKGSIFDLLNQLGQALDTNDELHACNHCGTTVGDHADDCMWKGASQDKFGNAEKIRRDDRLNEQTDDYQRAMRGTYE